MLPFHWAAKHFLNHSEFPDVAQLAENNPIWQTCKSLFNLPKSPNIAKDMEVYPLLKLV
jgi:hypothetical protein